MNRRTLLASGLLALLAVAVAGWTLWPSPSVATGTPMVLPTHETPLVAHTSGGDVAFTIEVADEVSERSAGLMFRQTMADDHGMLFVFEEPQPVGFWMKNTPMPLDLLFIGQNGVVRSIAQGEPMSEALIASREPVRFVLELKAGTSERVGIVPGTELTHPVIDLAPGAANAP
jgi:uncharacterized membrane protein (UPF0127 family)